MLLLLTGQGGLVIIKTVGYKRTKQVQRFEPEVIELVIDLSPGETPEEVIKKARAIVAKQFGEEPAPCSCDPNSLMSKGCTCGGA